jgi:glycosyl-4,4'-diaponeurosporenoate acyltransferase
VFHTTTGLAAHRLDETRLSRDGWLLRPRRFEAGGSWYRRRLQIHRWKDKVPEAGDLFRGGVSKRHLPTYDVAGLQLFARETRRAELAHWWAMACGPVFVLWNPPLAAGLLVGYGVIANLPVIAIQRYNRFRIQSLTERRVR